MTQCTPASVSVIIPSKGRPNELGRLLKSIGHQADEIIVLLDGPDYKTKRCLQNDFPYVNVLLSHKSVGPLYQRNRGATIARHEIIIFFDDDILLQSDKTILQTISLFQNETIGAVTIPFVNIDDDAREIQSQAPAKEDIYHTSTFYAGMVAFQRAAYFSVGGYREMFFMHVEESDIAIRMMNKGFFIRLGTADALLHARSRKRDSQRLNFLGARNHVLYAFFNVPMPYLLAHLPLTILKTLNHGIMIGRFSTVLRGILAGIWGCAIHFGERDPVAGDVYRLCRILRSN